MRTKAGKQLAKIWQQVPPDYYDQGIKSNLLQRLWHNHKITNLISLVNGKNFKRILDVGCADGTLTNKISRIFPHSKIFGVDVYTQAIAYGEKKYPHISFIVADAHKLPFLNNYFDLIICYETIEHVYDPHLVLKELRRVTKDSGFIILAMDSGNLLFRIVWWFWEKTKGKVWQDAHLHPFNHHQLEKAVQKAGFKVLRKHLSHWGMEVTFLLGK